jgi:cation:H+ antiporter
MLLYILGLIFGLILLAKSSDIVVENAVEYSQITGITKTAIGAIIISFLTSVPELIVTIVSGFNKEGEIILGNIIGSNIVNILLILGLGAAFFGVKIKERNKYYEMIFITTLISLYGIFYGFNFVLGLFSLIIFFLVSKNLLSFRVNSANKKQRNNRYKTLARLIFFVFILLLSAEVIVISLKQISELLKISKTIISGILVAFSTSIPELGIAISSGKKKEHEILAGNIFGSCFVNITLILAIGMLFSNLFIGQAELFLFSFLFGTYSLTFFFIFDGKIERMEGLIMLCCYLLFILLSMLFI